MIESAIPRSRFRALLAGVGTLIDLSGMSLLRFTDSDPQWRNLDRLRSDIASRGQIFAFIIAILFLILAGILIWKGESLMGLVMMITELVALVYAFTTTQKMAESKSDDE